MGLRDDLDAYQPPSKEQLSRVKECLPAADADELEELLADVTVSVPSIRRLIEAKYPDAPRFKQSTWDGWARARRG